MKQNNVSRDHLSQRTGATFCLLLCPRGRWEKEDVTICLLLFSLRLREGEKKMEEEEE